MLQDNIKLARVKAKLTQEELAKKIGVGQTMISYYEKGYKVPTIPIIIRIADVLDCSIDELVGRKQA